MCLLANITRQSLHHLLFQLQGFWFVFAGIGGAIILLVAIVTLFISPSKPGKYFFLFDDYACLPGSSDQLVRSSLFMMTLTKNCRSAKEYRLIDKV